jgi:small-conductance mechanosensitive channel
LLRWGRVAAVKQEGMLDHYQETYRVTHRYEYERNRLFILFILVLVAAIYLALNKELASQLAVDVIGPKTDTAREAWAKVNFYRIFSVISIMAAFYLIVNLHHRFSTIKRNYSYLGQLEREIRQELQIHPPNIAFTRESTFYEQNRSSLSNFVRISYSIILIGFVLLFLVIRLWSDWPGWPGDRPMAELAQTQYPFEALLFGLDIALGLPILVAVLAYVTLTFRKS